MKNTYLYKILGVICIILIITSISISCTTNNIPKTPTPIEPGSNAPKAVEPVIEQNKSHKDYIPLAVGNVWEYEGEGNEYASYTQKVIYQEGSRYQLSTDTGGTDMANIYELREDSIVNVFRKGEEYEHNNLLNQENNIEIILLKLPIEIGTKWISEENAYEIIDTHAELTVPFGTFKDCVVVKLTFKDGSVQYITYKDGVGMLQSEFRLDSYSIFSRLKSFATKKSGS